MFYFSVTNSSTSEDFFENSFSFAVNISKVSCCTSDLTLAMVSCGQGVSCTGQCSALGGRLCPNGNCTSLPEDCFTLPKATDTCSGDQEDCTASTEVTEESLKSRLATSLLPSWVFSWCPRHCARVSNYPACCYHPKCYRKKPRRCKWLQNYLGEFTKFSYLIIL